MPSRFRHLTRLTLRYARFDRSRAELIDPRTDTPLATLYPLDKVANTERGRRALEPLEVARPGAAPSASPPGGPAPLLAQLLAEHAATGLPPAYLPFHPEEPTR